MNDLLPIINQDDGRIAVKRGAKLYLCDSYKGWEVQIKKKYDKGREPFILPEGYRVLAIGEEEGK